MLISIQSLLGEPNNASPLNGFAAALWENQEGNKELRFLTLLEFKKQLHKKYHEASKWYSNQQTFVD